jgi:transposase
MGRPTKLTPETQARVCDALRLGATYELAAQYGGIAYNTFNEWRKRGESELDRMAKARKNTDARPSECPFVEFYEATKDAESTAAIGWLAKIEKAASDGAWQAAAWKLERRYPNDYGRTVVQTEHSGPGGSSIPLKLDPFAGMSDDDLDHIIHDHSD